VADDHPLFRVALREAVTRVLPEAYIVEAESFGALERALLANPDTDLILLDLYMPDADGFASLVNLRARYPSIAVAVISAAESATVVRRSMDLGASGFIPRSASIERICKVLRSLLEGDLSVPDEYAEPPLYERGCEGDLARSVARLTAQQLRVLISLSNGSSNKSIARDLGVCEATVKAHVTVVLRKLGLERRTQAALVAQRILRAERPIFDAAPVSLGRTGSRISNTRMPELK
jgi:DNA-binding NarL/FixJ family response regulator